MGTINIDEVRRYNKALKEQKEKVNKLNTQIEFYSKELRRQCEELSRELGVDINENNLEEKYNEYVAKLESTLQTGNAVLQRIAEEENASNVHVDIGNIPGMSTAAYQNQNAVTQGEQNNWSNVQPVQNQTQLPPFVTPVTNSNLFGIGGNVQ